MSPSHKVFRFAERGSHENIKELEEKIPTIDKHEVLVKIKAVSLNYRDIAIVEKFYPFPVKDNVIPLSDGAGEVVGVGSCVAGIEKGDRVVGNFDISNLYGTQRDWDHGLGGPIDGVLAEYVAFPGSSVTKISKNANMTWAQMASLVCTGVTAWNSLYGNVPLKPGQTVLFQGTGGVSVTGLMLAKAAGAVTIITSSSDDKLNLVKEKYGADHVINYKNNPDWASTVKDITGGRGVDFILENGGSGTIKQSIDAIARGGVIAIIGFLSAAKQEEMPDVAGLVLSKGCILRGINVGSKQLAEDMIEFVVAKGLQPPVEKVYPFTRDGIVSAYEFLKKGGHVGKICIEL